MTFFIGKEYEEVAEVRRDEFRGRIFASAFAAHDWKDAVNRYREIFEKSEEAEFDPSEIEQIPEDEADVQSMLAAARRAGVFG